MKINFEIPKNITEGITLDGDDGIAKAEQTLETAELALADAIAQLKEAQTSIHKIKVDVGDGRATPTELEDALRRREAAALMIEPAELREKEARMGLKQATSSARTRVIAEGEGRRDELQAEINRKINPLLEHPRGIDQELGRAISTVSSGFIFGASAGLDWVVPAGISVRMGCMMTEVNRQASRAREAETRASGE